MPDEEPSADPEPEPGGAPPGGDPPAALAGEPASESSGDPAPEEPPPSEEPPLSGQTLIAELLRRDPNAARVLAEEFELPCYRCPARHVETLAGGITYKGLEAEQILSRLRELRAPSGAGA